MIVINQALVHKPGVGVCGSVNLASWSLLTVETKEMSKGWVEKPPGHIVVGTRGSGPCVTTVARDC